MNQVKTIGQKIKAWRKKKDITQDALAKKADIPYTTLAKASEYMVDTADGSCGFTVHTIFQITGHLFQNTDISDFFAVSEKSGKDNSGDYVFVKNGNNQPKLDKNGHLIITHDLHNHDGELPDGVAEKFIEWAKSEHLSFWK